MQLGACWDDCRVCTRARCFSSRIGRLLVPHFIENDNTVRLCKEDLLNLLLLHLFVLISSELAHKGLVLEVDTHEDRTHPTHQIHSVHLQVEFLCALASRRGRPLLHEVIIGSHADDTQWGGAEEEGAEVGDADDANGDVYEENRLTKLHPLFTTYVHTEFVVGVQVHAHYRHLPEEDYDSRAVLNDPVILSPENENQDWHHDQVQ